MNRFEEILNKFWGYQSFRPLQLDIIESVASGRDTLGLLPTGGGKSITFQVPALSMPGICIVVTPLIALMKDQVQNLKAKNIKAEAIYTGLSHYEIDTILNNCVYGNIKFLYVSPERLGTEIFRARLPDMKVNLLAVDEAHCISQWGYDFRPAYLQIADIRHLIPGVPVLALTATATEVVVDDIQNRLLFKQKNVFRKSFERKNLVYWVKYSENKEQDLLKIVTRNQNTGIVYVRNRKKTKQVAEFLQENGIKADYYHAGLTNEIRDSKQNAWKDGITKVIVATNAFGMGIDKPDVRYVVHLDLPDSLEAYYQEAGRGGRDEKEAHAILLYNRYDRAKLRQNLTNSFPDPDYIKKIYDLVGQYYQIAVGEGKDLSFNFELGDFIAKYHLNAVTTLSALKILEMEGYIALTEEVNIPPKVRFLVSRENLYDFELKNIQYEVFIKLLLRNYSGLFHDYVSIDEFSLAEKSRTSVELIHEYLVALDKLKIIDFIPRRNKPQLMFTEERLDSKSLYISKENYQSRKENYQTKIEAAIRYAENQHICRSRLLLEYFSDRSADDCKQCDVCRNQKKHFSGNEFNQITQQIADLLRDQPLSLPTLVNSLNLPESKVLEVLKWLLDQNKIVKDKNGNFTSAKQ